MKNTVGQIKVPISIKEAPNREQINADMGALFDVLRKLENATATYTFGGEEVAAGTIHVTVTFPPLYTIEMGTIEATKDE